MKEFKQDLVNAVVTKAESERIINFYETAKEMGHKHISAQDCRDIMNAVLKALPEYRAVQMCTEEQLKNPATAGLFSTLTFVEKNIEFDEGADFNG